MEIGMLQTFHSLWVETQELELLVEVFSHKLTISVTTTSPVMTENRKVSADFLFPAHLSMS